MAELEIHSPYLSFFRTSRAPRAGIFPSLTGIWGFVKKKTPYPLPPALRRAATPSLRRAASFLRRVAVPEVHLPFPCISPALPCLPPPRCPSLRLRACVAARAPSWPCASHSWQRPEPLHPGCAVPYCELARAGEVGSRPHHLQRPDQLRPTATKPSVLQIPLVPFLKHVKVLFKVISFCPICARSSLLVDSCGPLRI